MECTQAEAFEQYIRDLRVVRNTITLEGPAGPMQFELSAVSTVRLCDDEDLFD